VYNPIMDTCIVLHTGTGHINATGVLVVDIVLLLTMLIGLLRHVHRNSVGVWKLLYHQVSLKLSSPSLAGLKSF
jgi:hypothetical protein